MSNQQPVPQDDNEEIFDNIAMKGHVFRFMQVECTNNLGFHDDSAKEVQHPKHGCFQLFVYKYKDKDKKKAKLVTGIDVIVSDPPSQGTNSSILRVIVYNYICNKDGAKSKADTLKYQKLIYEAMIAMYHPSVRIESDNMVFDIGGRRKKGPKSSKYIADVFGLELVHGGSVIFQQGIW